MQSRKLDGSFRPWEASYPAALKDFSPEQCAWRNLADILTHTAREFPDRKGYAVVLQSGDSVEQSFAETDAWSDCLAAYLRDDLGLREGDVIAILLPNSLHYPIAVFAAMKAGLTVTSINPLYTPREILNQITDSGAKALFGFSLFADRIASVAEALTLKQIILCDPWDFFPIKTRHKIRFFLKHATKTNAPARFDYVRFTKALKKGRARRPESGAWRLAAADAPALIQYTGGTTGVSKGAVLTHSNVLSMVHMLMAFGDNYADRSRQMSVLTVLPVYHIFAMVVNMLMFTAIGGRNVFIPNPQPLSNLRPALEQFPINWMTGVDSLFARLMDEEWFRTLAPKIDVAIAGGAKLRPDTQTRWEQQVGRIVEGYGLSETSCVVSINPLDGTGRPGSVGLPAPSMDVRVEDAAGEPVGVDEAGELCVRGPNVTRGYLNRPDENAHAFRDGWFATGDIVSIDRDGFITVLDRIKDVILVSGFNVFPNEIENVIAELPYVREVAVIGVPDAKSGEAPKVIVAVSDPAVTAEQILAHCRQNLTGYKIPVAVEFRESLPKSAVGKTLRQALRANAPE